MPLNERTSIPEAETAVSRASASAWGDLNEIRRRLVGLAVKLVWNRDDAEEIVQEGLRLAVEHGLNPAEQRFGPWMHRTVTNLCLSHRRKRKSAALADWVEPEQGETAADRAERIERMDRLRAALERLPDQQRLAIVLRTMEQMAYASVAKVMGVSEEAVRTHVHLARQKLAAMLKED